MESQIRPGHQREVDRGSDSLLVAWDEMNKEQDTCFVTSGTSSDEHIDS